MIKSLKITFADDETMDVRNFIVNLELHNRFTYTLANGASVTIDLSPAQDKLTEHRNTLVTINEAIGVLR